MNQEKTIYDHKWSDASISIHYGGNGVLTLNIGAARINDAHVEFKSMHLKEADAIVIAKHFNLLPVLSNYTPQEYLNGELVPTTNDELRVGGFMSEDRE